MNKKDIIIKELEKQIYWLKTLNDLMCKNQAMAIKKGINRI